MNTENFDSMDQEFMKKFENQRKQQVPEGLLKDFSSSVEKKIRESSRRTLMTGMVLPVLAFAALAVLLGIWRFVLVPAKPAEMPWGMRVEPVLQEVVLEPQLGFPILDSPVRGNEDVDDGISAREVSELVEEIEALKEIGVWTDEDDEAAGIPGEWLLSELELDWDRPAAAPSATG